MSPDAIARDCGLAVYYAGLIKSKLGHAERADALIRKALKMMIPDRRSIEALQVIKFYGAYANRVRSTYQAEGTAARSQEQAPCFPGAL